ncbi:MAG TPA: hypothetical protein VNL71_13125 [Chloroflexota bacterium]|nr:hypothetical protein [Chloroflexota bacterium]
MQHLDAKAIRERLNSISLALAALEDCSGHPNHAGIAHAARQALDEIAVLVTGDERDEHGREPPPGVVSQRSAIRNES